MAGPLPEVMRLAMVAFIVPGGWLMFDVVQSFINTLNYSSFFGSTAEAILLLVIGLIGMIAVAQFGIALMLFRRRRASIPLAGAFAVTLGCTFLLEPSHEPAALVVSLVAAVVAWLFLLSRRIELDAHLDSGYSRRGTPTSVVVSQRLILAYSVFALVTGILYLILADYEDKFVLGGIVSLAWAVGSNVASSVLDTRSRGARIAVTLGGLVYLVVVISLGHFTLVTLLPIGFLAAAVGYLWLPSDAKQFFGAANSPAAA